MDFMKYSPEQQAKMAELIGFVKETATVILGHDVDFVAVLHKVHGDEEKCTGPMVLTEAAPITVLGMMMNATRMVVINVEGDGAVHVPASSTEH